MSFSFRQTIATNRASKADNLFAGRSILRADEKKKEEPPPKNSALQAYLAKNYDLGDKDRTETGKRKKKKKPATDAGGAIRIVDQDVSGFNALDPKGRGALTKRRANVGDDEDDEEEEAPTIANPEEAAALIKLAEKAKSGSGWIPAAEAGARAAPAGPSKRRGSPEDASPPRRRQRHDSPEDASPPRRGGGARQASPQDASPPRRRQRHDSPEAAAPAPRRANIPDASPPRRRPRHDSPEDASPPRRGARHESIEASPPPRGGTARQASPEDASPPRRRQRHDSPDAAAPPRRANSPDASPPRRVVRADASPPRRVVRADASPPRRVVRADASPPRRGTRRDSPEDASPPRRGTRPDASPPRRRARHDSPDAAPPRRPPGPGAAAGAGAGGVGPGRAHQGPPERMGDGTAAGLVSAQQLAVDIKKQREQAEERRRNAEGRGAQTVYRDKATGRVMTADEALQAKEDERAARKKPSIFDEDQTLEWRGGLAQKREAEERKRAAQEEASKPFARADMDDHHDAALRDRVRFGDPFAHLARRKQPSGADALLSLTEQYDPDKLNKSGFKIPQEVPPHSWLKRGVAPAANRYNIRPGRHWDGVDRSTGFEKQMFKHQNARAAAELEARLWSMSDM